MNKQKYEAPEMEVILFPEQDILTASGTTETLAKGIDNGWIVWEE